MDKQAAVVRTMAACFFVLYPQNRPGFLSQKPGRFVLPYFCLLRHSRHYLRGFLMAAQAGAKITERSEQ